MYIRLTTGTTASHSIARKHNPAMHTVNTARAMSIPSNTRSGLIWPGMGVWSEKMQVKRRRRIKRLQSVCVRHAISVLVSSGRALPASQPVSHPTLLNQGEASFADVESQPSSIPSFDSPVLFHSQSVTSAKERNCVDAHSCRSDKVHWVGEGGPTGQRRCCPVESLRSRCCSSGDCFPTNIAVCVPYQCLERVNWQAQNDRRGDGVDG